MIFNLKKIPSLALENSENSRATDHFTVTVVLSGLFNHSHVFLDPPVFLALLRGTQGLAAFETSWAFVKSCFSDGMWSGKKTSHTVKPPPDDTSSSGSPGFSRGEESLPN